MTKEEIGLFGVATTKTGVEVPLGEWKLRLNYPAVEGWCDFSWSGSFVITGRVDQTALNHAHRKREPIAVKLGNRAWDYSGRVFILSIATSPTESTPADCITVEFRGIGKLTQVYAVRTKGGAA